MDNKLQFRFVIEGVVADVEVSSEAIHRWTIGRRAPLGRKQIRSHAEAETFSQLRARGATPGERWRVAIGADVSASQGLDDGDTREASA